MHRMSSTAVSTNQLLREKSRQARVPSLSVNGEIYTLGERVLYSDLSYWEIAEIVAWHRDTDMVDLLFVDGLQCDCMIDGMKKLTAANYKECIG